jgi:hypothetical protein
MDANIDVTTICREKLCPSGKNMICIPKGDSARASYFTDPACGESKFVFVSIMDGDQISTNKYDEKRNIYIDTINLNIYSDEYQNVENVLVHPISFSIPEQHVINGVPKKTKMISNIVPGKRETYIYDTEEAYFAEYRSSMFAVTSRKAGFDCLRHYEIIANGCIPYFEDIEHCPSRTMTTFPKNLIRKGNSLYSRFGQKSLDSIDPEERKECDQLITHFLEYTKKHLTTKALATYVFAHANVTLNHNTRVLFLSSKMTPDYLRCLTLHGFKTLLGDRCHDYPLLPFLYKSYTGNTESLYGKGYSYSCLLDPVLRNSALDQTVEQDIREKKYNLIVYGTYHEGLPFYDLVFENYAPSDVIMMCGEDLNHCRGCERPTEKGHHVFIREL